LSSTREKNGTCLNVGLPIATANDTMWHKKFPKASSKTGHFRPIRNSLAYRFMSA
jgi:hypothetical protein